MPPASAPPTLHVVVADDSAAVRGHLVEMLEQLERVEVVAEAEDSAGAVSTVDRHHPEVVVLDIQMPGENGIVALQRIKARWPETSVIMLTNHNNPLYRRKCMEEGASFFFDKSTEFERVLEAVQHIAASGANGSGGAAGWTGYR